MNKVYYNENDRGAAQWLRQLIKAGLIPNGEVDERSIVDVRAADLAGYGQCHFFAGIGGWAYALKLANWREGRAVWTGSCPCQPFSSAGKRKGFADARDLWPIWFRLIAECRPSTIFGEQVSSKDGEIWLDRVYADLEGRGYSFAPFDLPAAGVGSPNIRQRFFWLAHAAGLKLRRESSTRKQSRHQQDDGIAGRMGNPGSSRRQGPKYETARKSSPSKNGRLGDAYSSERWPKTERRHDIDRHDTGQKETTSGQRFPGADLPWSRFDVVFCAEGKMRRLEPSSEPLVNGLSGRVGLLRGYGNAINPILAAEFIQAADEAIKDMTMGEAE